MGYKDLCFMGFEISDPARYDRALEHVRLEIASRDPETKIPDSFTPEPKFRQSMGKFYDEYRALGYELIARAEKGADIDPREIQTLDRAERLYAISISSNLEQKFRSANLDKGREALGEGSLSMTQRLKLAAGVVEPTHRERGRIEPIFTP